MSRLAFLIGIALFSVSITDAEEVLFEKHIRPILKTHCFQCHGEEGVRESELDVRLRRWIVEGGDSGPAIEPGNSDDSLLLERVASGDMPPGGKPLSDSDIDLIRRWISQGAKTVRAEPESIGEEELITEEERNYWAFQPIRRPPLPQTDKAAQARNPIDLFVLARLQQSGFEFSEPADRRTLMRRVHFDLLGLPPTPEALDRFVTDTSPDAVGRMIDSLLASPRYGERWGRHWLDVAGYADSEGYTEEDRVRPSAFRYRDYVIRAFNDDKPMDDFIREQLAGDEMVAMPYKNMAPDDIDKLTATGFLRMAPDGTASGGVDQNVARNQTIADTINIVSTSLLAMTVGCAQCHDHRYDPIPQADYYRMRAIFAPALDWKSWRNPNARKISLYTDSERQLKSEIEKEVAVVETERKEKIDFYIARTLEEELENLDESLREPLRAAYKTPAKERTKEQTQLLKEHPSVQNISAGSLYLYDRRRDEKARKIDSERKAKATRFVTETRQRAIDAAADDDRDALVAATKVDGAKRDPTQQALIAKYPAVLVSQATLAKFNPSAAAELETDRLRAQEFRDTKTADDLKRYADKIAEIRKRIPVEGFIRALTEPAGHSPPTHLFYRGDHEQPRQVVAPGGLAVLHATTLVAAQTPAATQTSAAPQIPAGNTTGRRLTYATHLTSGDHPLVARVIVNRVWAQHFGHGIVRSLGDFGLLGERPTHPELLDWLAAELMESGWQLKHLHRLILTSTTYRQSSRRSERLDQEDPDNWLLGRMSVRRLESEAVRDSVLAVSGNLNRSMYGQPVPVREDDVGQIVIGEEKLDGERKPVSGAGMGGEESRRSVYIQVRRSRPLAVLETFDAPRMTPNCSQRSASNVAPQPLMMMNSNFAVVHAGKLAQRVVSEVGEDRNKQIRRAWCLALGVEPTDAEVSSAADYLEHQSSSLNDSDDVLATLCHALLSTNRFLYID